MAFDYFLLKTMSEPGIVDWSESLSLFHLVSPFTPLVRDESVAWFGVCFGFWGLFLFALCFRFLTIRLDLVV